MGNPTEETCCCLSDEKLRLWIPLSILRPSATSGRVDTNITLAACFRSGGCRTFDQTPPPVAGETKRGRGLRLGKPELGEGGNIRRTEPVSRSILINRPPASTLRSLGPVNFHGSNLPCSGNDGEQIRSASAFCLIRHQPPTGQLLGKNVPDGDLQLLEQHFELAQRDALLGAFQPVERGGGDAEFPAELAVTECAPLLAQELP